MAVAHQAEPAVRRSPGAMTHSHMEQNDIRCPELLLFGAQTAIQAAERLAHAHRIEQDRWMRRVRGAAHGAA